MTQKKYMQEILVKVSDLRGLPRRSEGVATVIKNGDEIYADVVFPASAEYCRAAHRDGKSARSFGSVETAVRALNTAGFADVIVKNLDADPPPAEMHFSDQEVVEWEQRLDEMGHHAPIEDLRDHLANAPAGAPSRELLIVFLSGYDRAKNNGE